MATPTCSEMAETEAAVSLPLDVFRIIAGYLPGSLAKMRLAVAVADRERIAEIAKSVQPAGVTGIQEIRKLKMKNEMLGITVTYDPFAFEYSVSDSRLPGFFVKVSQKYQFKVFIHIVMDGRAQSTNYIPKRRLAFILNNMTMGLDWIWRYTEKGLKGKTFGARPWDLDNNEDLADTWEEWVAKQIYTYTQRNS